MRLFATRLWMVVAGSAAVALGAAGCNTKHTITVEPIYLKLDVNVKLDRELDDAFDYQERIESEMAAPPATQTQPATPSETGGAS